MKKEIFDLINKFYFQELKASILFKLYAQNTKLLNAPNIAKILEELAKDKFEIHLEKISEFLQRVGAPLKMIKMDFEASNQKENSALENIIKIFENVIKNEECSRELALEIASSSCNENDHDTYEFIQWFVKDSLKDINELSSVLENLKESKSVLMVETYLK